MSKEFAKGVLGVIGLVSAGALGVYLNGSSGRMRRRSLGKSRKILEVYTKMPSQPRDWFLNVIPDEADSLLVEGRMWTTYPVRVNREIFGAFSLTLEGVFLQDRDLNILYYKWGQVKELGTPLLEI